MMSSQRGFAYPVVLMLIAACALIVISSMQAAQLLARARNGASVSIRRDTRLDAVMEQFLSVQRLVTAVPANGTCVNGQCGLTNGSSIRGWTANELWVVGATTNWGSEYRTVAEYVGNDAGAAWYRYAVLLKLGSVYRLRVGWLKKVGSAITVVGYSEYEE